MVGSGYDATDGTPSAPPVRAGGPLPSPPPEPTSADGRAAAGWYRTEVHHSSQAASGAFTNSSVIVESAQVCTTADRALRPLAPPVASTPGRRLRHPSPPGLARSRDGRLALRLSAAAIEAARVNAPLPMPAYPRLDVGDAGYVGTLLQWQNEGRLSARKHETVDGGVSSKLARMQQ